MGSGLDPYAFDSDMDLSQDADGDGLTLVEEYRQQTDPFDPDSPGSGSGEQIEAGNASGTRRTDGEGKDARCLVEVTIGDWSGSESERWDLTLSSDFGGRSYTFPAPNFGEVETIQAVLPFGTYRGDLIHRGSSLAQPDFDWIADVECVQAYGSQPCLCSVAGDLQGRASDDYAWASRSLTLTVSDAWECDLECVNGGRCVAGLVRGAWVQRCECPRGF
mmetsp:Transcript_28560/g.58044  ORF Transcript_28560/g.58044 Transcript_28560/m.58044 type:complete len:219 (+) Transcript_28560:727-1383(+)